MSKDELSPLSLLKGRDFKLTDSVYIKHPTVSDIENIGENVYNNYLSLLCTTSLDVADILWFDMKIWYEDIKDEYDFFLQRCISDGKKISVKTKTYKNIPILENDCIAIGEDYRDALNYFLNLSGEYIIVEKTINNIKQKMLYNVIPVYNDGKIVFYEISENSFKFTKFFYEMFVRFLNSINWIEKKYEFLDGGTKGAKKYLLKHTMYNKRGKKNKNIITIDCIVSSLIARGCSVEEVWNLNIYTMYNIYYRLVKIDDYNNTMYALYNGCIDTKKNPINWEKINWSSIIK